MLRKIIQTDEEKCNGCGGSEKAAKKALQTSATFIPWQLVTISIDGKILS